MKIGRYIRAAMAWGERIGVIAMLIVFTVLAVVVGG